MSGMAMSKQIRLSLKHIRNIEVIAWQFWLDILTLAASYSFCLLQCHCYAVRMQ